MKELRPELQHIDRAATVFEKAFSPQRDLVYEAICKLYKANRLYMEASVILYDRVRRVQDALHSLVGPDWLEKESSFVLPEAPRENQK